MSILKKQPIIISITEKAEMLELITEENYLKEYTNLDNLSLDELTWLEDKLEWKLVNEDKRRYKALRD